MSMDAGCAQALSFRSRNVLLADITRTGNASKIVMRVNILANIMGCPWHSSIK